MPPPGLRQHGIRFDPRSRPGAIVLAAALLVLAPACAASAAEFTTLRVAARVAAYFRVQIDYQAPGLAVTSRDVGLGYVDVPAASRFFVTTNSREAYLLEFRAAADWFQSVVVGGPQGPVEMGPGGGIIVQRAPALRSAPQLLSYRFYLRPEAQPGNYSWPLLLSVRPM